MNPDRPNIEHRDKIKPKWEKPTLESEQGELERTAEELGLSYDELVAAFKNGTLQELRDADWEQMVNTDSRDTSWTLEEVREHLEGKRDFALIESGFKKGDKIPAPVVLRREGGPLYLIGGNSRLLACRALKVQPTVFVVDVEPREQQL